MPSILPTNWQADKYSLMQIRETVFMREQKVSAEDEWDGQDDRAIHFLMNDNQGQAIGCARMLDEIHQSVPCFHIGRVALLKEWRNQGLGHQLMRFIMGWCEQQSPAKAIYLHAQTERIRFYQQLHFVAQGDIFMDAGIPHIAMWYKISQ